MEPIGDIDPPCGISDVWFQGRARRSISDPFGKTEVWIARFQ